MINKDILVENLGFTETNPYEDDRLFTCYLSRGARITVLDRMTGFGWRGIETGFTDSTGKFWLYDGDIRKFGSLKIHEAILKIKNNLKRG